MIKDTVINKIRTTFQNEPLEKMLAQFTKGKGASSFFVKLLPQPSQYSKGSLRNCKRDDIFFQLDLSEYMEFVYYFGLKIEEKGDLYKLIKKGDIVFDIGVNFGETLLNFAKLVGDKGTAYGFEPVPFIHEKAVRNIGLNNYKNIKLNNLALSDQEETLFFDLSPYKYNSGGVKMNKTKGKQEVKGIRLDDYIAENKIEKIDLIKIDVEGFETNVLKGGRETLKKLKPKLFIEVDDNFLKVGNSSAQELIELLSSLGYSMHNAETSEEITTKTDFGDCHFDVVGIHTDHL